MLPARVRTGDLSPGQASEYLSFELREATPEKLCKIRVRESKTGRGRCVPEGCRTSGHRRRRVSELACLVPRLSTCGTRHAALPSARQLPTQDDGPVPWTPELLWQCWAHTPEGTKRDEPTGGRS